MAISNTRLAALLGADQTFISRCAITLLSQASVVFAEQGVGATHEPRAQYGQRVVSNPVAAAAIAAPFLAQSANVYTTITIEDAGVTTSVTDAALLAQVSASWNDLAGISTGN